MNRWAGGLAVVIVAALVVGGCSSKKDPGDLEGQAGSGAYGEESLSGGAASGGSLALAQQGKLGAGDTGPLRDVRFDYDSFDLDDASRQTLQENADWLKDHPDVRVEIEGHCDDRGTVEYNLALGAKRAAAAKNYLVALGISRDRMTTISYGEELPICHEETEACWSENRRAHFAVIGN
ncbi:MAG: peptidoglycan-associated lipoprotein Pal [Candidatus Binatia bacterium]